jgi:hypothetical protein
LLSTWEDDGVGIGQLVINFPYLFLGKLFGETGFGIFPKSSFKLSTLSSPSFSQVTSYTAKGGRYFSPEEEISRPPLGKMLNLAIIQVYSLL